MFRDDIDMKVDEQKRSDAELSLDSPISNRTIF